MNSPYTNLKDYQSYSLSEMHTTPSTSSLSTNLTNSSSIINVIHRIRFNFIHPTDNPQTDVLCFPLIVFSVSPTKVTFSHHPTSPSTPILTLFSPTHSSLHCIPDATGSLKGSEFQAMVPVPFFCFQDPVSLA